LSTGCADTQQKALGGVKEPLEQLGHSLLDVVCISLLLLLPTWLRRLQSLSHPACIPLAAISAV
jgi:hypothetical protein